MRMSNLTTSIQHYNGGSSQYNEISEIIFNEFGMEEVKLYLFADDMMYIENPKKYNF